MNPRPTRPDVDGDPTESGPVSGFDQLSRERLPGRDLWPGIDRRLKSRRRRSMPWSYALAASVCIATVAGLLLRAPDFGGRKAPVSEAELSQSASSGQPDGAGWERPREDVAANLPRQARTLRSESWDGLPDTLASPGVGSGFVSVGYRPSSRYSAPAVRSGGHQRTLMRANLKLITQAERELKRALREDPESESLRDLLSTAESQRLSLQGLISTESD